MKGTTSYSQLCFEYSIRTMYQTGAMDNLSECSVSPPSKKGTEERERREKKEKEKNVKFVRKTKRNISLLNSKVNQVVQGIYI